MDDRVGRTPPITTSGQAPPLHDLAPELHRSFHSSVYGGVRQRLTLWQWLSQNNRRKDYRARQAALAVIERLLAAMQPRPVGEVTEAMRYEGRSAYIAAMQTHGDELRAIEAAFLAMHQASVPGAKSRGVDEVRVERAAKAVECEFEEMGRVFEEGQAIALVRAAIAAMRER